MGCSSISTNFPVDTMEQSNGIQDIKGQIRSGPYMFTAEKKSHLNKQGQ